MSFQPAWLKIQCLIPDWPFVCVLICVKPWCFILVIGSLKPIPGPRGTPHIDICPQPPSPKSSLPCSSESSHSNGFQFCSCCLSFWVHCAPLELELPARWLQTCPHITSQMVLGLPQQFLSGPHSQPLCGVPQTNCLSYMLSLAWELFSCLTSLYYHLFCQGQKWNSPNMYFLLQCHWVL